MDETGSVVPHLIDYLHDVCGIRDEDMVIVIATGTHEGDDPDILAQLVTPEVMRRIEVLNHDCGYGSDVYRDDEQRRA